MREDSAGFTLDALPPPPKKLPNQDPMSPLDAAGLGAVVALPPPSLGAGCAFRHVSTSARFSGFVLSLELMARCIRICASLTFCGADVKSGGTV